MIEQTVLTTDADLAAADAETGAELLRLRREVVVLKRALGEALAREEQLQAVIRQLAKQRGTTEVGSDADAARPA